MEESQSEHRPRERDRYVDVGIEMRAAIDRAIAAGALNRVARVFLAVVHLTPAYSRLNDPRVYVAQIAAIAKILGDVDERHTRRALATLAEARRHRVGAGARSRQCVVAGDHRALRKPATSGPPFRR